MHTRIDQKRSGERQKSTRMGNRMRCLRLQKYITVRFLIKRIIGSVSSQAEQIRRPKEARKSRSWRSNFIKYTVLNGNIKTTQLTSVQRYHLWANVFRSRLSNGVLQTLNVACPHALQDLTIKRDPVKNRKAFEGAKDCNVCASNKYS